MTPIAVASYAALAAGRCRSRSRADGGSLALDGEREIERRGDDGATVRLADGPLRIDVDAVMSAARNPPCNAAAE